MKKRLPEDALLIPKKANLVFEGEIYDVYQWPQRMYDGSIANFEMLKRPDTVQILGIRDGKLVMVNDEQPNRSARIHFPGGRVDKEDESWLAAAKREMLEETGLSFKNWKLIYVYQDSPKIERFTPWYVATEFIREEKPKPDPGERIQVNDLSFEEVRALVMKGSSYMNYAVPVFVNAESLNSLLERPEFEGREVDR